MSFWNDVGDFFSDVADGIGDVATDVWHGIEDGAEVLGDFMVDTLPLAAGAVGTIAGGPVGGFIAGTGANYLQSMLDKKHAKDQLETEMAFNAEQAALNRQFQVDMWEKNNLYNSPEAQLKRLMAAGVNPNMMFGNGYNAVGSSAPSGSQATSPGSIANGFLSHTAQVANLMANAQKNKSDADLNKVQLTYDELTFGQRVKAIELSNEETRKRIDNLIQDKDIQRKTFDLLALKSSEELRIMREQLNVLRTQWLSNLKSIEKTDQDIIESQARVDLLGKQSESQDIQNKLKSIELEFCKITGFPLGTPVEERLFSLYKEGKFDDVLTTYMVASESAYSKNWIAQGNVLLHSAADEITKLVDDIKQDASKTFTSPFWQDVKKGSKRALANFIRSSPYAKTNNRGKIIYNP